MDFWIGLFVFIIGGLTAFFAIVLLIVALGIKSLR
jgi:hypothetical protein